MPESSASSENDSRVPPFSAANRYSPVGRTGPAIALNAIRVSGSHAVIA